MGIIAVNFYFYLLTFKIMGMYVCVYEQVCAYACSTQEFQKVASDTIEQGLHVAVN